MGRDDDRYKPERPIFCGNFQYDATLREIERLFDRYGPLERVDMKTAADNSLERRSGEAEGFAFVYMKDRRDGDDACRALNGKEHGERRRRLRVEWSKGDGEVKRREDLRRRQTNPSTTLFVVNFDPDRTRERDLERHFEPYGRLVRVQIKRNYAFVQYENIDQATDALKGTHLSRLDGRTLSVEYVSKEPGGFSAGGGGSRERSRSPYGRKRSRSPSYGAARSRSPVRSPRRVRSPSRSPRRSPARRSYTRSRSPVARDSSRRDRSPSRSPRRSYSRSPT